MTERSTNEHFLGLVQRFQLEAWLFLGKMVHPESQKVERNLAAAKHVIDSLGMLEEKTKGNLSTEEERFLQQVVTTLRLNFVDEANRKPESEAADEAARKQTQEAPESEPEGESKDERKQEAKEETETDVEETKQDADGRPA